MQNIEHLTQRNLVLNHLRTGRSITPLEALGTYAIYRLAAVIRELRKDGHNIVTNIKRSIRQRPYAEYHLVDR